MSPGRKPAVRRLAAARAARADSRIRLAVMGVLVGLTTGGVVLAFRGLIELAQRAFLPDAEPGNYEALPLAWRLVLPPAGAALLGAVFMRLPPEARGVGITHVIAHLRRGNTVLPLRNAIVQFLAGALAIVSGQSVDREGPGVHLGAATGSALGQLTLASAEDRRTLLACGAAAAIAAAFNTPLAGVAFAMELVTRNYGVPNFAPVIVAAGTGAVLAQAFYGPMPAFVVPILSAYALAELPAVLALGIACGALSALFITVIDQVTRHSDRLAVLPRFVLAGSVTALCAIPAPQVMGVSYDSVAAILDGSLLPQMLLVVLALKLAATAVSVGAGLPGGLIGPTLLMGVAAGTACGELLAGVAPGAVSDPGFYALLGMGAVMGATLRAPLAALTALLELTGSAEIILPGLIAVIAATLTCTDLFGRRPVFDALVSRQAVRTPEDYAA